MNFSTTKAEIIISKEKAGDFLEKLQSMEIMEIISSSCGSSDDYVTDGLEPERAKAVFARSFLLNYAEKEGALKNIVCGFIPQKHIFTAKDIEKITSSKEVKQIIKDCVDMGEKLDILEREEEEMKEKISLLENFQDTSVTVKNKDSLKLFSVFAGIAPYQNRENLLHQLKEESFFIEQGDSGDGFVLIYPKEKESVFSEALSESKVKEVRVFWENNPVSELRNLKQHLFETEKDILIEKSRAERASAFIPQLEALIDYYDWEMEKNRNFKDAEKTQKYFSVRGWVEKRNLSLVEKVAEETDSPFMIREIEPEEGEEKKVVIRNEGIVESFSVVSDVYGAPRHNEPDPTPYLAPFFALFFGLALSDSGYGVILIVLSLLAKRFVRGMDPFFNLLAIAGVFTFFAGLFTGTVFGTDVAEGMRFFDPVADPMSVLILVFVIGFVQIIAGLVIGAVHSVKEGKINTALGEKGGSIIFLLLVGVFVLTRNINFIFAGLTLLVLMNVFFSEERGLIASLSSGGGALYGVIGYFSDVLSYSRLLALGLSTGIIAMVVNMIASIAMDMIPVAGLGFLVAGLVLIVGHTFNLVISALSSFIHSARLQFVEFFSKFMEGGGTRLKPFSKRGRFVEIIN